MTGDSVRAYLRDIGRIPLLEHDEEIILGRKVQRLMEIKACEDLLGKPTKEELAFSLGLTHKELRREIRDGEREGQPKRGARTLAPCAIGEACAGGTHEGGAGRGGAAALSDQRRAPRL